MQFAALHRLRSDTVDRERALFAQMQSKKAETLAAHSGTVAGNCSINPDHQEIPVANGGEIEMGRAPTRETASTKETLVHETEVRGREEQPESSASDEASECVQALAGMDIFGLEGKLNPNRLPVLKVWYDLAAHIDADAIPDPLLFVPQYDAVTR